MNLPAKASQRKTKYQRRQTLHMLCRSCEEGLNVHVLIVAPEGLPVPPTRGGSVQIYLQDLIQAFDGQDLSITLLSPGKLHTKLNLKNVTHDVYNRRTAEGVSYHEWALQRIEQYSPDIIEVENRPKFAAQAVKWREKVPHLKKTKVILNLHSTTFLGPLHAPRQRVRGYLTSVDSIVVNSEYLKQKIVSQFRLSRYSSKVDIIYPGVDSRRFMTASPQTGISAGQPAGIQEGTSPLPFHSPIRLIFIGRVIQLKGVTVLISTVRRLGRMGVPVSLTIVGRTPPWERQYGVRARNMSRGLPITWRGFVSRPKLPALLGEHDILVCPSQRREAFGLVNLEAMAAGKPVIASRVGGIPEVVTSESGILVTKYHAPMAFANAVRRLVANPNLYKKLQSGARQRAETFSWTHTAHAFQELYHKLSGTNN